jgi:hypothetical protein
MLRNIGIVGGIGVGELTATIGLWQAETSQGPFFHLHDSYQR